MCFKPDYIFLPVNDILNQKPPDLIRIPINTIVLSSTRMIQLGEVVPEVFFPSIISWLCGRSDENIKSGVKIQLGHFSHYLANDIYDHDFFSF